MQHSQTSTESTQGIDPMSTRKDNLSLLKHSGKTVKPGQKFLVDDFRPEDAQGVAELYYAVYGENFPVDYVYDPKEIAAAAQRKETHLVVGRTETGDIVGLYALFRNPPGKHIMEAGSWIVLPSYRNTTLAMRMAKRIHTTPPPHLELNAMFGQQVCDHLITQKMGVKYNTIASGLEIEAMPPRPEGGVDKGGDRISLLDGVIVYRDIPHAVYLPVPYAETFRKIYTSGELSRKFLEDGDPAQTSTCTVQSMDHASLIKMTVHEPGIDLSEHLERMIQDYPGRHVYQLVLPLTRPGVSYAVDAARKNGFFLAGMLPLWDDKDAMLMQRLPLPTDYSKIQLYSDEAKALLDIIIADRESLPATT
jgi:hypothetical protein